MTLGKSLDLHNPQLSLLYSGNLTAAHGVLCLTHPAQPLTFRRLPVRLPLVAATIVNCVLKYQVTWFRSRQNQNHRATVCISKVLKRDEVADFLSTVTFPFTSPTFSLQNPAEWSVLHTWGKARPGSVLLAPTLRLLGVGQVYTQASPPALGAGRTRWDSFCATRTFCFHFASDSVKTRL